VCFLVESCGTNFENVHFSAIVFLWKVSTKTHFKDYQFLPFSVITHTQVVLGFWLMFFFPGFVKKIMPQSFIHPTRHFLRLSHNNNIAQQLQTSVKILILITWNLCVSVVKCKEKSHSNNGNVYAFNLQSSTIVLLPHIHKKHSKSRTCFTTNTILPSKTNFNFNLHRHKDDFLSLPPKKCLH
jgi:hypothetical protein